MKSLVVSVVVLMVGLKNVDSACTQYDDCTLPDGQGGFCIQDKCRTHIGDDLRENLTFTISVRYPETVLKNHGRTALYVRGNGLGLLWMKGKKMLKTGNDMWSLNVTFEATQTGYRCQTCIDHANLPNNKLEYRILADDRDDMLGANFVINFPISEISSYFDVKPVFTSYPWFYEKTGELSSFLVNSTYIGNGKNVTLYTPPSFKENIYKTYQTFFVLDLSLKYARVFKTNFESPIYPNAVSKEYALIGFGDFSFGKERTDLLTVSVGPDFYYCKNGTYNDNCNGCIPARFNSNQDEFYRYLYDSCGKRRFIGGQGDKTLDFLEKEALPFANKLTSSRLRTERLGVMGYSHGGLTACHAIWTRPLVYSLAACQSPSFWWPFSNVSYASAFDFVNKTLNDSVVPFQTKRLEQKIYLDAGGGETADPYREVQSTIEAAHVITRFPHYELNKNVWMNVAPNKHHSFLEWAKRMGQAFSTLLPAGGASGMPSNEATPVG